MNDEKFFDTVGTEKPARRAGEEAVSGAAPAPTETQATVRATGGARSWAEADGMFYGTASSHAKLPSGLYRMEIAPHVGPVFIAQKNDTDTLVSMPDSESAKILEEIRVFQGLKPAFKKHGFLYKRGILMWGPPGSGKTCTLQLLVKLLREAHDGVAALIERPSTAATCLQALRRIEPERQVVGILEDLDALVERYGESEYLALLDGESQIDNVVYVATTNYPERLDRRFVDRPSRFDTIRYIGMPSSAGRRAYLQAKVEDLTAEELDEYVSVSDDYSVAHLRELIILTKCFGMPLSDSAERLNKTRRQPPSSDKIPGRPRLGFGG